MGFLANPANRTVETSSKTHGLLRAPSPCFSIRTCHTAIAPSHGSLWIEASIRLQEKANQKKHRTVSPHHTQEHCKWPITIQSDTFGGQVVVSLYDVPPRSTSKYLIKPAQGTYRPQSSMGSGSVSRGEQLFRRLRTSSVKAAQAVSSSMSLTMESEGKSNKHLHGSQLK